MKDIDELSKIVPCICKVSPNSSYHIEDVNRAGGVIAILGELEKQNLLDTSVYRADGLTLAEALSNFDITRDSVSEQAKNLYLSSPGGVRNLVLGSQNKQYEELDIDRVNGCVRSVDNAYYKDGGLAILFGNLANDGCVVKTAGVDESLFVFKGNAKVFNSQDAACSAILEDKIVAGDVVVINYEGPRGGPGMQEMLYPTSYLKSKKLDKVCALITDGRFSGGTSGLSIGHVSPEAASGGNIGLIKEGDVVEIDIKKRLINVLLTDQELNQRRQEEVNKKDAAFKPVGRNRNVSKALKTYAYFASSADKGAVRLLPENL